MENTVSTSSLTARWEQVSRKFDTLAQELPEHALEQPLVANARTVGAVLRHVAFWNQYLADTLSGKAADDSSNELASADYPTKARLLTVLTTSSARVLAALRAHTSLDSKSADLVLSFLEHTSEHYGQLATYSRLLGIVPVTSRT